MKTGLKIILTIVVLMVGVFIMGFIKSLNESNTSSGTGVVGIVIGFALVAAIRAIWKYNPEKEANSETRKLENDKHKLDKT
jgi:hypothetical protein